MARPDILALGEPLVEMVRLPADPEDPAAGRRLYRAGVGGDVLNALVAAARQGAATGLISALGEDAFGREILEFCRAEGIETGAVAVDPRHPTGFVWIDPDPVERRFSYARAGSAASRLGPGDVPEEIIAAARVLHLSGVSLAISDSMRAAALHAARIARAAGVTVSFDLNFRPALWSAAAALEAIDAMLPLADIVLPSLDEAEALTGLSDEAAILDRFGRDRARIVILKCGADGARLATDGGVSVIPAHPVVAVDSSGAGDSFAGAFLAHYLETGDPLRAAEAAARVAAATVTGWGATDSIPRRTG